MIHVLNTWILANLLHVIVIWFFFGNMGGEFFPDSFIDLYIPGTFFSFLGSVPAFVVAIPFFYGIKILQMPVFSRFVCWVIIAAAIPLICYWFFALVKGYRPVFREDRLMLFCAPIAAAAAVIIRTPFFFRYFIRQQMEEEQQSISINEIK